MIETEKNMNDRKEIGVNGEKLYIKDINNAYAMHRYINRKKPETNLNNLIKVIE